MKKTSKTDRSLEAVGSGKKQPRNVKPPPTEHKKTSPSDMPVKRRAQKMVALPRGKRERTESGQDGINIDRALEMAAKRQLETEQGAAKLAQCLVDEMEKKKSAERKIRSLLLKCKYGEIPSTLPSFGAVQLAIKDIASNTDHEDIVRLASQQLVRMNKKNDTKMIVAEEKKEMIVAEGVKELVVAEETEKELVVAEETEKELVVAEETEKETGDANEMEVPPTTEEAILPDEAHRDSSQDEDSSQGKKHVQFSDKQEFDDTWEFN